VLSGEIITIGNKTHSGPPPKSLADILAEELDAELGDKHTQELRVPEKQALLEAVYKRIHKEQPTRSALCLSGGGIRSATFGLGILQGLARCGLLDKFHYLSTVSGGGYIGSWLSAWIKNHPQGIDGVVKELSKSCSKVSVKDPHDSALNPDPRPIRHLRKFSNYLTPKTGLTSVDFWTLIATFIRNMFLNWLVLISLLGAVMMIPRFFLVAITLAPNWAELATKYLKNHPLQPNWDLWADSVKHQWDIGLTIFLAVGFALVAVAMAYAIIDVPSTGKARFRFSQRHFLIFRTLPLLLASLIFAAWWAVFRNVHGGEPFQPTEWRLRFIFFAVASYLSGGLLATTILLFRKDRDKARPGRFIDSFLRTGIVLTAAFAGVCLWAMATRIFLVRAGNALNYVFFAEALLLAGLLLANFLFTGLTSWVTKDEDRESWGRSFLDSFSRTGTVVLTTAFAGFCLWAMATRLFLSPTGEFLLKGDCEATLIPTQQQILIPAGRIWGRASFSDNEFTLKRDCEATLIPTQEEIPRQERITLQEGDQVRFAEKDRGALEPMLAPAPAQHALNYVCFAPALILGVLMLVNFLFTGLASWVTEDEDREWWGRSAAWILITIVAWIVFNVMVLWGAQAITATTTGNQLQVFFGQVEASPVAKAVLGAFGGVSGIAGALLALRSKLGKKLGQKGGFQSLLVVVAVVFFLLLPVVISWALLVISSWPWVQDITMSFLPWDVGRGWHGERLFVISFLTGITLLFGILMGFFINANTFSLHAIYRNRLIRAYLAASCRAGARKPNLFTGFDPEDNFELHKLSPERPLHVLNGALNLVKGEELAWQERKAESFTMSRLHCGSWHVGYRPSTEYGKGITLGTALAISGAAANPNMGYHSSPVVGFLMTLFNVRLGWWLGNPGSSGAKTWHRSGPHYSVGPLFSEAMGNTTDRYKYVNLSDGGHFENLGLYEMVLRRCHYVVVSDAGEDPECSFADLGEAIRKIRIDLGIPIEFDRMSIYPRGQIDALKRAGQKGYTCAIGRIGYSELDRDANGKKAPDGILIYIKPACYGEEPRDIYEYFKRSETFPHESTADQFFSESQFESYRMLGLYTMQNLCEKSVRDFPDFIEEIQKHLTVVTQSPVSGPLRHQTAAN